MSFLYGYGFTFMLIGVMLMVSVMQRLLPKELGIALIYGMIFIDGILAYTYYFGGAELVFDERLFRLGIALAFMTMTVVKCTYFAYKRFV